MNKFAAIVFILLISCGAALWFLASDSLNNHIKSQLKVIGSELTQLNVSVESVNVHSYQGSGTITNLLLSSNDPKDLLKRNKTALEFSSIDLIIDRTSLKEEVIIIESITFHGLNALVHYNESGNSLEKLLLIIQHNAHRLTTIESNNAQGKQPLMTPRLLSVSKVIVKSGTLELKNDKNEQASIEVIPEIELQKVGEKSGSTGEKIGMEILENLLVVLNNQMNMMQKSN